MTLFLTDTERQQLRADLLKAEHLALEHARLLRGCQSVLAEPPVDMLAPAFHPERMGYLSEVAAGDRVMVVGQWEEVAAVTRRDDSNVVHLLTTAGTNIKGAKHGPARIQKQAVADPLAMYRLPAGAVGFVTTYADQVKVGDWVQRCHGDPDWHLVTEAAAYPEADDGREWVRLVIEGGAVFWLATDAIRVATAPDVVVASQDWEG